MRRKERHLLYEAVALCVAGLFGAFAVPELVNAHNTVAAFSAFFLFLGWVAWFVFFLIRATNRTYY
jgi:hypothetical protein